MQSPSSSGSLALPFLGLGISATVERASELLHSPEAAAAVGLSSLGFLNLGLNTTTVIPTGLPEALRHAGLDCVVHFEELNLVGGALDSQRLLQLAEKCRILLPKWSQEDLGVWVWDQLPLVEHMIGPIFDKMSLRRAVSNTSQIMDVTRLPFLIENPPIYFALGDIDLLNFMAEISRQSGCELLLDIGHFISYCLCIGCNPLTYLTQNAACLQRVVEVHLAGYELVETTGCIAPIWFDRHDLPLSTESLELLDRVLALAPGIKAITLEVEGSTDAVIHHNVRAVDVRVQAVAA